MAIAEQLPAATIEPADRLVQIRAAVTELNPTPNPWPGLWAMIIGFFMILIDTTIVSVATPAIMTGLDADVNAVTWVTSGYLLAYAVPLLVTGRLGVGRCRSHRCTGDPVTSRGLQRLRSDSNP